MARALVFNNCAASHLAARLHDDSCPIVAAARKSRGKANVQVEGGSGRLDVDDLTDTIADLNERGFAVKECKCLRADIKREYLP